jgi:magnesium chelatase accessory protein
MIDSSGMRWNVHVAGDGPDLLLVHGTGSSLATWRGLLPALAEDFRVVAVDLPGHGGTDPLPRGQASITAMANALARCRATLGSFPAAAVGHSAGAALLLRMTLDRQIDPRHIVAINPALMPYGGRRAHLFAPLARALAAAPVLPWLIARRAADPRAVDRMIRGTGSVLAADGIATYQRLFADEGHVRSTLDMMAGWDLGTLVDELGPIAARVHLVVGTADMAVPPSQSRALRSRYPAMRRVSLRGAGHLAHEERPAEVAALIRSAVLDDVPQ